MFTECQLRLSDRKGTFLRNGAEPVPNGAPIDATITFFPTSAIVPAGWRLRLLLASGDTSSFATRSLRRDDLLLIDDRVARDHSSERGRREEVGIEGTPISGCAS
jgi:X-Pro dipeptidyl-peptidase C-terminal non-catalytic domain